MRQEAEWQPSRRAKFSDEPLDDDEAAQLSPFQRELVRLLSTGHIAGGRMWGATQLAKSLNTTTNTVRKHMRMPVVQRMLQRLEERADQEVLDSKARIRNLVGKAIEKVAEKMHCGDDTIELRAAGMILDRDPETQRSKEQTAAAVLSADGVQAMLEVMREMKNEEAIKTGQTVLSGTEETSCLSARSNIEQRGGNA